MQLLPSESERMMSQLELDGRVISPSVASTSLFRHIPTLDGWRAVAVLAVVFYHSLHHGLTPGTIWFHLATRAHLGVDVFFAISGFLICGKLLDELRRTGTISLTHFYIRRCFRILPPVLLYLLVLALLTACGWLNTAPWEFASTLFFVRNYFPVFHGGEVGVFTAQFWSLAVEEHFYLLWPGVLLLIGPRIRRIASVAVLLALAIFAWRTIDAANGWLIPYGSNVDSKTDTRLDALLWGCLAAVVYPKLVRALEGFDKRHLRGLLWLPLLVLAGMVILAKPFMLRSLCEAILFPSLLLSTALAPGSWLGRLLELPAIRWIGRMSYSIYIWQELVMFSAKPAYSPLHHLEYFPINLATILLTACASYYLVERPMIRLGHRLTPAGPSRRLQSSPLLTKIAAAS
jgi:peptidoglycan/LPS O-acetylase OafA/YrhL